MMGLMVLGQVATGLVQRLGQAVSLMVVGMLVVFSALSLTAVAIVLLSRFLGSEQKLHYGQRPERRPETDAVGSTTPDVQLQVVLAAAATAAIGRKGGTVRITCRKG